MTRSQALVAIAMYAGVAIQLNSCASTNVASVDQGSSYFQEADERRLWLRSKEEQDAIERSGLLLRDSVAREYLQSIVDRLTPENVRKKGIELHVRIVRNPLLNAFAYPNGGLYIHTGIIASMGNEAQLATLLGHELGHVFHRHALKQFRSSKNANEAAGFLGSITIPFGLIGAMANLLGAVGSAAAVSGYSRDLEREADSEAFTLIVKAGYDCRESAAAFRHLKTDLEQSGADEPFFFGTHPRIVERIESMEELLRNYRGPYGGIFRDRFYHKTYSLLKENVDMDLAFGRLASARRVLDQAFQKNSTDPDICYFYGEFYRRRAATGDIDSSLVWYRRTVDIDSTHALGHRGIGFSSMKKQENADARKAFRSYLDLLPDAADRKFIEQYLDSLR